MIGGEGFSKSQFNLATQGERRPGSSFKPFVLAAALAEGVSPETTYESKPQVINIGDKLWAVRNYENAYLGSADLTTATIYSDNTVYAQLTAQVGPKRVAQMAHKLGDPRPPRQLLRNRPRRRGRQPARDGEVVRDLRELRKANRR